MAWLVKDFSELHNGKVLYTSPAANANSLRNLMFCAHSGTLGAEVACIIQKVCYFAANAIATAQHIFFHQKKKHIKTSLNYQAL